MNGERTDQRRPGMPEQPSQAVQDYLKAIHRLGGADKVVGLLDHIGSAADRVA